MSGSTKAVSSWHVGVALAALVPALSPAGAMAQPAGRAAAGPPITYTTPPPPDAALDPFRDALGKAYQYNPTLNAQRAVLRQFDERVNQQLSNWRPVVRATINAGVNRAHNSLASPALEDQTRYPANTALSVTQPIFRGFRTVNGVNAAENDVLAQRGQLHQSEQQILIDAATAYRDVLRDLNAVELNTNNERVLTRQLEATQDRFRVGEVTRTDVAQSEARLAQARANRIAAEGTLATSRSNFRRLIGDESPARIPNSPAVPNLPTSRADAVETAQLENPNVVFATYQEAAARDRIKVAEGTLYPSVNLIAQLSDNFDSQVRGSHLANKQVFAEMTVPLYESGLTMSQIRESKQLAGQRRSELEIARRNAVQLATQAWENLQTARAQIASLQTNIRSLEIALEGVQQEALVGTRTTLDVLNAEQELLNGRVALVNAQRDEAIATFNLAASVGRMTADNLSLPVQFYDYRAYYNDVRNRWWGTGEKAD